MASKEVRREAALVAESSPSGRQAAAHEAAVLASAVLEGAAISGEEGNRLIPKSWFVSLEELFERLVRKLVSDTLGDGAKVGSAAEWPGRGTPPPLFPDHSKRYPSNPDLFILQRGRLAIGDANYKDFDTWPGAADVHQLIAHAAACKADRAALFYPCDGRFMVTPLGLAATGCRAWAFGLDLSDARKSVIESMRLMELLD